MRPHGDYIQKYLKEKKINDVRITGGYLVVREKIKKKKYSEIKLYSKFIWSYYTLSI